MYLLHFVSVFQCFSVLAVVRFFALKKSGKVYIFRISQKIAFLLRAVRVNSSSSIFIRFAFYRASKRFILIRSLVRWFVGSFENMHFLIAIYMYENFFKKNVFPLVY